MPYTMPTCSLPVVYSSWEQAIKGELIIQFVSQGRRLSEYPLRRRDGLFLILRALRRALDLELLHQTAVFRAHEVDDTVSRPFALGAGSGNHAVAAGAEHAVRESHRRVAEVDDGAASLRLYPQPLAGPVRLAIAQVRLSRRLRPDLQAAEPVHQDGDSAGGSSVREAIKT